MITIQQVRDTLQEEKFSPLAIELFTQMYTELPYQNRQICAQQLTEDSSLAAVLYELLKNKSNLTKAGIETDTFVENELCIINNYLTT